MSSSRSKNRSSPPPFACNGTEPRSSTGSRWRKRSRRTETRAQTHLTRHALQSIASRLPVSSRAVRKIRRLRPPTVAPVDVSTPSPVSGLPQSNAQPQRTRPHQRQTRAWPRHERHGPRAQHREALPAPSQRGSHDVGCVSTPRRSLPTCATVARAEVDSDLWEHLNDAHDHRETPLTVQLDVLALRLRGVPSDLVWCASRVGERRSIAR